MGFSGFCMASLHTVLTVCALSSESVSMAFTFCLSFGLPEGWNSADASFPFRAPLFLWILCSFLFEICPTRDERLYYTLEVWKSGLKKIISLGNFLHNEENSTALFFSPIWCQQFADACFYCKFDCELKMCVCVHVHLRTSFNKNLQTTKTGIQQWHYLLTSILKVGLCNLYKQAFLTALKQTCLWKYRRL